MSQDAWPKVALRRVLSIVNGGTPTTDLANWDGGVSWATPVDLSARNGGRLGVTARTLTPLGLKSGSRSVPAGSLIVSIRAPVGYVAETSAETAFNQGCRGLVPATSVDARYFRYQLGSLTAVMHAESQGSTFQELSSERLAQMQVVAPPVDQQRRIADHLDAETARIDTLIAKRQRQIELLRDRFESTVSQVTRSAAAIKDAAMVDAIAVGWQRRPLRRCFSSVAYGIGEASRPEGSIAVLGMGNVGRRDIVGSAGGYVDDVDGALLLQPKDLLFNRTNSLSQVGKVAIVKSTEPPTTVASYVVILRTVAEVRPEYLNFLVNTSEMLGLARSTALPSIGQANLNPSRWGRIRVALPPLSVQRTLIKSLMTSRSASPRLSKHSIVRSGSCGSGGRR